MIGQQITFTTNSSIYNGKYCSTILDIKNNMMTVSIPYHNGVVVLPGVGTRLNVNVSNLNYRFQCEILERDIIKRHMKVSTPNSISRVNTNGSTRPAKVISITSGKGGVGKTSFCINFALALVKLDKKVLIFDADLGMANVDVLLNVKPEYDIQDVISGTSTIKEIVTDGPGGISLIPGASGLQQLAYLSDSEFNRIISGFNEIEKEFDYILIDTGAGLSKNVTDFLLASDEILLVTTPEPHAIMDAYSIIKVLTDLGAKNNVSLVINKCESKSEALGVLNKMRSTSHRFLNVSINYIGHIFEDKNVSKSIKFQMPFMLMFPDCSASKCIREIAQIHTGVCSTGQSGVVGFLNKLKKLF